MTTAIRYGRITDEGLDRLRGLSGQPIRRHQPHVEVATPDAIRHYAHGIGDPNPLWLDEGYARGTRYGGLLALPTMLYAFDRIVSGYVSGLPGVHAMYAGTDWEWFRPLRAGERIIGESTLKALVDKSSEFASRAIQQIYTTTFLDEQGERVAVADSWCFRTERDTARDKAKYADVALHRYTSEELEAIWADYDREEIRGATPRYYEDVPIGDRLTPVVKGPYTPTTAIAYVQGWGGLYVHAHRYAMDYYRRHPSAGVVNAQGVPEPPERVHWDSAFAQEVGVPAAYDYGPERVSWMGHLLTNWIGDDGFLKKLWAQVRRHNLIGDTTWCHGQVVDKGIRHGVAEVEIDLWADNQRGERTVQGHATVVLPRRDEK